MDVIKDYIEFISVDEANKNLIKDDILLQYSLLDKKEFIVSEKLNLEKLESMEISA